MAELELNTFLVNLGFDCGECSVLLGKFAAHVWKNKTLLSLLDKLFPFPREGKYLLSLFVA